MKNKIIDINELSMQEKIGQMLMVGMDRKSYIKKNKKINSRL